MQRMRTGLQYRVLASVLVIAGWGAAWTALTWPLPVYVAWWPPAGGLSFGIVVWNAQRAQETGRLRELFPGVDDETRWEAWRITVVGPPDEPPDVLRTALTILDGVLAPRREHTDAGARS